MRGGRGAAAYVRRRRCCGEQKANMLKLFFVVLRKCTVAVKDVQDVEHSVEVTAETLR